MGGAGGLSEGCDEERGAGWKCGGGWVGWGEVSEGYDKEGGAGWKCGGGWEARDGWNGVGRW